MCLDSLAYSFSPPCLKLFRSQHTMGTHDDAINLIIPGRSYNGSSPMIKNLNSFMCKNLFKGRINQLYLHIRMGTILQKRCSFRRCIPAPSQCLHLRVLFSIDQKTLNKCHCHPATLGAFNLQTTICASNNTHAKSIISLKTNHSEQADNARGVKKDNFD